MIHFIKRILFIAPLTCVQAAFASQPVDFCAKNRDIQREVLRQISNPRHQATCDEVSRADLNRVTALQVDVEEDLRQGDFDGFVSLGRIDLTYRGQQWPSRLFDGLPALEIANVSWHAEIPNYWARLPDDLFGDSKPRAIGIQIRIDRDGLTPRLLAPGTPSANLFRSQPQLTRLTLEGRLRQLPAAIFRGLTRLRELNIADNYLQTLPAGIFEDLISLDILQARLNRFTSIDLAAFDPRVLRATKIDLEYNRFTFESLRKAEAALPRTDAANSMDFYDGKPTVVSLASDTTLNDLRYKAGLDQYGSELEYDCIRKIAADLQKACMLETGSTCEYVSDRTRPLADQDLAIALVTAQAKPAALRLRVQNALTCAYSVDSL